MNDGVLLNELEELAGKLGIEIRYANIATEESRRTGGLCRVGGKYLLIIHRRLPLREKIGIIARALRGFDLEGLYLMPVIRELLRPS